MIEIDRPTITTEVSSDAKHGKFIIEPLERGYGQTLGNSLRRVLLSSLPGFAITQVRIDGVEHEFKTLKGVKEDVVEILLNLKDLHAKIHTEDTAKTLRIEKSEPGKVTAGDIIAEGDVEIINTDLPICTLAEDGAINMEMILSAGRGYVPSEKNKDPEAPIGWLPMDSNYSPVEKVNFTVAKTRVGENTDFDKLTLEVWTNGTIEPAAAVALGSQILIEHFSLFSEISDVGKSIDILVQKEDTNKRKVLDTPIDDLELSPRAYNCLKRANINTVEILISKTKAELKKVRNFGEKSLEEIVTKLAAMNLELREEDE